MRIKVTPCDQQRGKRYDPSSCPIALACNRIEGVMEVGVHYDGIDIHWSDGRQIVYVPDDRLLEAIQRFDEGLHPWDSEREYEFHPE